MLFIFNAKKKIQIFQLVVWQHGVVLNWVSYEEFSKREDSSAAPGQQKTSKKTSLFFLHDVTSGLVFFSKSPVYGLVRNHVYLTYPSDL